MFLVGLDPSGRWEVGKGVILGALMHLCDAVSGRGSRSALSSLRNCSSLRRTLVPRVRLCVCYVPRTQEQTLYIHILYKLSQTQGEANPGDNLGTSHKLLALGKVPSPHPVGVSEVRRGGG